MNIKLDIPADFFKGEERSGHYVTPEIKRLWAVQLDLIAEFARVCEKQGLKWWAAYGTLIGAARHNGFIPWDDDVDIFMMRADYERILEVADEFRTPYRLGTMYNSGRGYGWVFAKLYNESTSMIESSTVNMMKAGSKVGFSQGIFIDIFPVDDFPDDEAEAEKFLHKARRLQRKFIYAYNWTSGYSVHKKIWKRPIKSLLHRIFTMLNVDYFPYMKQFDEFIKSKPQPDSKRVASMVLCWYNSVCNFKLKEAWDRSLFDETIYLPFEMLSLPAPAQYDKLLTQYFGDWRKPVIVPAHGAIYDTEHPYTYYINKA